MHRRINPHRRLIGVFIRNLVVHGEKVAVPLADLRLAQPLDGVGKIQIHPPAGFANPPAFVTDVFGRAAGNVARGEIPKRAIHAFQVVIAVRLRNVRRIFPAILLFLGHPDAAVVAQGLAHECELGLVIASDRDAGRMDLRETGVGKARAPFVSAPDGSGVRAARVGGEIEHVAVSPRGQHHGIGVVPGDLAGAQVAHNDALRVPVHDHQIQHLRVRVRFHAALGDHLAQRRVRAEQQLLPGLAARVKRARHLRPAKRTVVQQAAVFPRERHALRHALVNDVHRHLGQAIDVRLARPEVAAFDGVVKQAVNRIPVVLIILGGVDAALRGDRVRAPGGIVKDEVMNVEAQLRERGGGGRTRQAGAHDDDLVFAFVRRIDEPALELVFLPLLRERAGRDVGIQNGHVTSPGPFRRPPRLRPGARH